MENLHLIHEWGFQERKKNAIDLGSVVVLSGSVDGTRFDKELDGSVNFIGRDVAEASDDLQVRQALRRRSLAQRDDLVVDRGISCDGGGIERRIVRVADRVRLDSAAPKRVGVEFFHAASNLLQMMSKIASFECK